MIKKLDIKLHPPSSHAFCLKKWLIDEALEEGVRVLNQVYLHYLSHGEDPFYHWEMSLRSET